MHACECVCRSYLDSPLIPYVPASNFFIFSVSCILCPFPHLRHVSITRERAFSNLIVRHFRRLVPVLPLPLPSLSQLFVSILFSCFFFRCSNSSAALDQILWVCTELVPVRVSNSDRTEADNIHERERKNEHIKKCEKPPSNTWYVRRYVHAACVYDVSNTSQYMQNICLQLVTRKRAKK